jgi:lipopolysaccharide heptosyltransferase I
VLVVRLGALGDIVHAVPAVMALARSGAHEIDWLVERRHRPVLDLFDLPARPVDIDTARWLTALGSARALRSHGYDLAIDLQGLIKSAALARFSGARRVVGFAARTLREPLARFFYDERIDPGDYGHVVQKNVALVAGVVGLPDAGSIAMPLRRGLSPGGSALAGGSQYAVLNPGAGWPNKRWPPERFGALAQQLARTHGLSSLVVWGPGEDALAQAVVDASAGAARRAPQTSLADLVALVDGASLVVAGDTGPLHLAAAAAAPLVGLFGPTDPKRNGPWSSADVSISRFAGCGCHHKRRCVRAQWCLGTISVDEVADAAAERLARASRASTPTSAAADRPSP